MKRKIFIAVGIVAAIFVVLAGIKAWQIHAMIAFNNAFVPPPETISSAVAHEENWRDTLTAVGSVDPQNGVTLASEVAGTVAEITVADGSVVAKGDLLIKLDTSSEEAQLRSAEAHDGNVAAQCRTDADLARGQHGFPVGTGSGGGDVQTERRPTPTSSARPSKRKPSARRSPGGWASGR